MNELYKKFRLHKIKIPVSILAQTEAHLRHHARRGHEGMVFWTGSKENGTAIVKRCFHPAQNNTAVTVDIPVNESQRINVLLEEKKEFLIAQVHSHPGEAFHSSRDDGLPITFTMGFFSLVVPNFCNKDLRTLSDFEVFEHMGYGEWRYLYQKEKKERFVISE